MTPRAANPFGMHHVEAVFVAVQMSWPIAQLVVLPYQARKRTTDDARPQSSEGGEHEYVHAYGRVRS